MTSETIALVMGLAFGLPFVLMFGYMIWRDFVSPEARARSLGVERGLDGADWHSSPFESSRLTKAYQDGIEDARLFERRSKERQHFKKDLAKLKK